MSSLRDVAERAGVSVATTWRVVHGMDSVRPDTRDRVERAMRELLYVPQSRPEATGAIGLLVPEFANPVFAALAQAMETYATRDGLATILCNTAGSASARSTTCTCCSSGGSTGWCSSAPRSPTSAASTSHYSQLIERGANSSSSTAHRSPSRPRPSASTSAPRAGSRPST